MSLQSLVFGIPLSFIALGTGIALGSASKWGVAALLVDDAQARADRRS